MNIEEKYNKLISIFYEISKIPRNSKHEEKIAEYLCGFAKKRNLYYRKDEYNNVLIKKEASLCYENKKTILFQAHTDMVCQKTSNSTHDFESDPIEIIKDENTLRAKDTTLGADDGIGVSYLLLLLDDEDILHPDIECLFTTQEEIGMNGARAFDYSDIKASYLLNLDGEEENTAIVGCAGGVTVHYTKTPKTEIDKDSTMFLMKVSGLFGGHSGVDIDKERINSNYLIANILNRLDDVKIISFIGGKKDNAIPNETEVKFKTSGKKLTEIMKKVLDETKITDEDQNLSLTIEEMGATPQKCLTHEESKDIVELITKLNQGVIAKCKADETLVETSGNIGVVKITTDKVEIVESLRSSVDSEKLKIKRLNNSLAREYDFQIEEEGEYPGWEYNPNSKLKEVYTRAYKKVHNGIEPIVAPIHAGVECGMIYEKLPHLDMISLGPDVKDVHTVNETLYLDSCKKMLETLLEIIENLD